MENFSILNNIEDAVVIVNKKNELLFQNLASKKQFGNLANFSRIKKYFNFDICVLNPDDISKTTPIDILLDSAENFFAYSAYQKSKDEYIYFNISSLNMKNYKIIIFKDVTDNNNYQKLDSEYQKLYDNYNLLTKENKKYIQLKEKAQEQAVKMGLLNRISLVIRESTSLSSIINTAIKEINILFGSSKTYFAKKTGKNYKIEEIVPSKYTQNINKIIKFDSQTDDLIKQKQIIMSSCIKEYEGAKETLSSGTRRIIIPIHNKTKLLGIVVILTTQKNILKDNIDMLEAIAAQLSVSLVQTSLLNELNVKNKKLEKTLNELKETQLQLINTEKMASLGQLVAGVAHEINTPLASINSNNDLIKRLIKKGIGDESSINMITELNQIDTEAIKRISNIVKSLKKFVRLDEAELQSADINKELDLTLQLLTHETKNNIKIIKNYKDIPQIQCYVNMLNQVFMNIIMNACQSIKEKKCCGEIIISTEFSDKVLTVSIKDNGTGMSKEVQNNIFHAGFTTKGIGIGTGLGLAISNKIIQKHKGTITFNTKENEGTEFIIRIPAQN